MAQVIDLEEGRLLIAVKRGYRNWSTRFKKEFGINTTLSQISTTILAYLAQGNDKENFYLYDLIMNLEGLGSGFDFNGLKPKQKMTVIDRHLFLLDQIRFECMKRLGWLELYPGEDFTLVKLITEFDKIGPLLQAKSPMLNRNHIAYDQYSRMHHLEKETYVRMLIPKALEEIKSYSTIL